MTPVDLTAPPGRCSWLLPLALLVATGALLGLSTVLAKVAVGLGLTPLAYLAWSIAGAAAALTAVNAAAGKLRAFNRRNAEYFIVAALVSVALPNFIFFSAVSHVGAGFVALSIAFPPLYTYLGAVGLGMERFDPWRGLGVGLALGGAGLMAWHKFAAPDASIGWLAATLLGSVLLAVGNIYRSLRWPPGARPDELAPGVLAAAALMLITGGLAPGASLAVPVADARALLLVLVQAAAFSVQYLLFFMLQKLGGPVYLSLLGSVAAIVGVLLAMLLLGEAAPEGILTGGSLIAGGVALLTRKSPTPKAAA